MSLINTCEPVQMKIVLTQRLLEYGTCVSPKERLLILTASPRLTQLAHTTCESRVFNYCRYLVIQTRLKSDDVNVLDILYI